MPPGEEVGIRVSMYFPNPLDFLIDGALIGYHAGRSDPRMRAGHIAMSEVEFSSSDYDCGAGVWRPISASQCLRIVDRLLVDKSQLYHGSFYTLLGYVNGGTDKVGRAT